MCLAAATALFLENKAAATALPFVFVFFLATVCARISPGGIRCKRRHRRPIIEQMLVLSTTENDDGSVDVEWIEPDRRFVLTFERDPGASSWTLVGAPP